MLNRLRHAAIILLLPTSALAEDSRAYRVKLDRVSGQCPGNISFAIQKVSEGHPNVFRQTIDLSSLTPHAPGAVELQGLDDREVSFRATLLPQYATCTTRLSRASIPGSPTFRVLGGNLQGTFRVMREREPVSVLFQLIEGGTVTIDYQSTRGLPYDPAAGTPIRVLDGNKADARDLLLNTRIETYFDGTRLIDNNEAPAPEPVFIKLANGAEVTPSYFVRMVNDIERTLAAQGQSLRFMDQEAFVAATLVDTRGLNMKGVHMDENGNIVFPHLGVRLDCSQGNATEECALQARRQLKNDTDWDVKSLSLVDKAAENIPATETPIAATPEDLAFDLAELMKWKFPPFDIGKKADDFLAKIGIGGTLGSTISTAGLGFLKTMKVGGGIEAESDFKDAVVRRDPASGLNGRVSSNNRFAVVASLEAAGKKLDLRIFDTSVTGALDGYAREDGSAGGSASYDFRLDALKINGLNIPNMAEYDGIALESQGRQPKDFKSPLPLKDDSLCEGFPRLEFIKEFPVYGYSAGGFSVGLVGRAGATLKIRCGYEVPGLSGELFITPTADARLGIFGGVAFPQINLSINGLSGLADEAEKIAQKAGGAFDRACNGLGRILGKIVSIADVASVIEDFSGRMVVKFKNFGNMVFDGSFAGLEEVWSVSGKEVLSDIQDGLKQALGPIANLDDILTKCPNKTVCGLLSTDIGTVSKEIENATRDLVKGFEAAGGALADAGRALDKEVLQPVGKAAEKFVDWVSTLGGLLLDEPKFPAQEIMNVLYPNDGGNGVGFALTGSGSDVMKGICSAGSSAISGLGKVVKEAATTGVSLKGRIGVEVSAVLAQASLDARAKGTLRMRDLPQRGACPVLSTDVSATGELALLKIVSKGTVKFDVAGSGLLGDDSMLKVMSLVPEEFRHLNKEAEFEVFKGWSFQNKWNLLNKEFPISGVTVQ